MNFNELCANTLIFNKYIYYKRKPCTMYRDFIPFATDFSEIVNNNFQTIFVIIVQELSINEPFLRVY